MKVCSLYAVNAGSTLYDKGNEVHGFLEKSVVESVQDVGQGLDDQGLISVCRCF